MSIVTPCRNEAAFVQNCLDSILASDYPKDSLEIVVVDGMSEDGSREIVKAYAEKHDCVRLLDNPRKVTPVSLNIGVRNATGDFILILGVHSMVDGEFIRRNVETFRQYAADCVGGVLVTLASKKSVVSRCIAFALSHSFGVGNSYFRIGSSETRYVDTVPFGCYKRDVFERIGLFDEDLIRNQDDEFNLRLVRRGGKILLNPRIVSRYYARDSLSKLWRMMFQYGYFKPLVAAKVKGVLTWRQLMPALFVAWLAVAGALSAATPLQWPFFTTLLFYAGASLAISSRAAVRERGGHLLVLPVVFPTIHFAYGLGYIKGAWDFLAVGKRKREKLHDMPMTR